MMKKKALTSSVLSVLAAISGFNVISANEIKSNDNIEIDLSSDNVDTSLPEESKNDSDNTTYDDENSFEDEEQVIVPQKKKKSAKSKKSKKSKYATKALLGSLTVASVAGVGFGFYKRYTVTQALDSLFEMALKNYDNSKGKSSLQVSEQDKKVANDNIKLLVSLPKLSRYALRLDSLLDDKYKDGKYRFLLSNAEGALNSIALTKDKKVSADLMCVCSDDLCKVANDFYLVEMGTNARNPKLEMTSNSVPQALDAEEVYGKLILSHNRIMRRISDVSAKDASKYKENVQKAVVEVANLNNLLSANGYNSAQGNEANYKRFERISNTIISLHKVFGNKDLDDSTYEDIAKIYVATNLLA